MGKVRGSSGEIKERHGRIPFPGYPGKNQGGLKENFYFPMVPEVSQIRELSIPGRYPYGRQYGNLGAGGGKGLECGPEWSFLDGPCNG